MQNRDLSPSFKTGFWGIQCESGKTYSQVVEYKFCITMAALDPRVTPTSPCVSLMVEHMEKQYLLCNLTPNSILQVNLNLYFEKGESVSFSIKGVGVVHLSGYYIYDSNDKGSPQSFQKSPLAGPAKTTVQHQNKMSTRFKMEMADEVSTEDEEETKQSPLAGPAKTAVQHQKKMSTRVKMEMADEEVSTEDEEETKQITLSDPGERLHCKVCDLKLFNQEQFDDHIKGKRHKKNLLKTEVASPKPGTSTEQDIPVAKPGTSKEQDIPSPSSQESIDPIVTFNDMEMLDDESSSADDSDYLPEKDPDAQRLERYAQKRIRMSLEEDSDDLGEESDGDLSSDEESSDESVEDEEEEMPKITQKNDFQNAKRLKIDTSTPLQGEKSIQNTPTLGKNSSSMKLSDMNSSIGRTPMPKKKASSNLPQTSSFSGTPTIKTFESKNVESSDSDIEELNSSVGRTPFSNKKTASGIRQEVNQMETSDPNIGSKKDKKLKSALNDSKAAATPNKMNESISKAVFSKKLPGGVAYEDIRVGNGPLAKRGKLVHVFYTGKLENNKVFDSRQAGSKPFSFKLGFGQVIKGWELGIEGMKVGGKRRLKVPPQMGYGKQKMGDDIPPNSTLYFIVELKAVS